MACDTALAALLRAACDDPEAQQILADYLEESGSPLASYVRLSLYDGYDGYGDDGYGGYGGGGYGGGGYGDGGGADDGGGYGGDGGGGGDGGYGGDGGDGCDCDYHNFYNNRNIGVIQTGLHIIYTTGGYYPLVRIAWCRPRPDGVSYDLVNARVIGRFGLKAQIAVLAEKGPQADTVLLEPAARPEPQFAVVNRCVPCNPKAWAKEMPRPKGWKHQDEEVMT